MKKQTLTTIIALGAMITSGFALTVSAQVANQPSQVNPITTSKPPKTADLSKYIAKADQEIDRRIQALSDLATRVQAMKKISSSDQASLAAKIQDEQTKLSNLKAKIDADTDLATLKADVKSITESYRIFMLIMPQIRILAAVDRINAISASMTDIGTKLQARISALQAAGKDVTALQAALSDYNAKIADANTQAQAASSRVLELVPDNGDKTVQAANTAALKQSRADITVANKDFAAARADAKKILDGVKGTSDTATTTPENR